MAYSSQIHSRSHRSPELMGFPTDRQLETSNYNHPVGTNIRRSERGKQEEFLFRGQSYFHLRTLGEGNFAKIHLVERGDKKKFALKVIEKAKLGDMDLRRTKLECTILSLSKHNFVVNFFNFYENKNNFFLLLSYYEGGDLHDRLDYIEILPEGHVKFYLAELTLALEYIHKKNIIHRDVKLENILIHGDGHIALTDFGLAKIELDDPTEGDNGYCGTIEYMSPEMVISSPYSYPVDVWAFGVIMFELLTGRLPFEGNSKIETKQQVVHYNLDRPIGISDDAWLFIRKLLCKDPNRRPSTRSESNDETNMRNEKFFMDVDWTKAMNRELCPPSFGISHTGRS